MQQTDGDKKLYAIIDQYGHTMMQVWLDKDTIINGKQ